MNRLTKQGLMLVAGLLVLAMGCTRKNVNYSEFMGVYDRQGATAEFVYVASGVDLSPYDKVMLDYLVLFMDKDAAYQGIQADALNEAAMAFHQQVMDRISPEFSLVDRPGPGVLRIRSALTNVSFSRPESNLITTVFPEKQAVSVRKIPENPNLDLEKAFMEFEFLDSLTQERLALAVDPCPRVKTAGRLRWEVLTETFERMAVDLAGKLGTLKAR
jgi:hypothetical protein